MAEVVYTEQFASDLALVELDSKVDEILSLTDLLEEIPELGSKNLPASIRRSYGESVRKLVVDPFDIVYEYDQDAEAVYVLGIVHQRAAW